MNFFKLISVFILLISYHTCFGQTLIHRQEFGASTPTGWTIFSSGGVPTWSLINNGATIGSCGSTNVYRAYLSANSSNDDFIITEGYILTAGYSYSITLSHQYTGTFDIYVGTSQTVGGMTAGINILSTTANPSGCTDVSSSSSFVPSITGTFYFGFRVRSNSAVARLDNIRIYETAPVTITWDGSSNTDWSTSANWDLNRIPNSTDIIIVPSGLSNYPLAVPNGSFNSLSLTRGTSGTTTIGTTTFSGNVTLNSSFTSNTITFNGTTSIGGNLAVGTSGNNFNFTVNGATNVNGTFTLGAVNTALATTINNPITVVGAFTMGNNSNHATTISYSNSTTKAITASNSGSLVFYGTVNYTASSGDQIIMKSQYNGALNATNGAKRYMEGELDLNSSLTMSSGDWYCGSSTTISISGTQGTDGNVKLSNSPYKGSGISGRWQGLFVASDLGSIGANDLITSISFYIDEKFSDRAYNNFTIKAALIGTDKFTQLQPSGYWPFFTVPMTTVFSPKNVTTINQSWNTHSFDVPFSWDGVSTILIEITFNNLAAAGGSGLAPDGTSDDKVAYIGGAWGNNIIVQTSSANSNITTTSYGSNSNYKNVSMFNAANGPFNINITNNWLNSGANFYHLRNTVTFDGNSNQQVTTRGDNYFNYVVNNTYNDGFSLTLNDDCEVENNATFQDGVIQTGSNKLVLMSSDASKLLAYSNASYVKGTLRRFFANNTSTYAFPLGKGYSSSTYFLSDVINSNLVGVNYLDGTFIDGFPTGYSQPTFQALGKQLSGSGVITRDIKRLDQAGYTQLDPNQQPTGGSYSLKMYAENYTLGDWIDNHQCIMKRPTGSNNLSDFNMAGTIYADQGLGRMVSQHYLLSTNLTSFSEFAAGLGNPVALPIQLVYFGVKRKNTYASLEWKTGTELNNDYFSVERSKDGINFKQIGKVKGSGTSSHEKNYLFIDSFPFSGLSYYRLKQVDYDAKFEYSPIKAINFDFSAQNDFIIYPNPLENNDLEFIYSADNEGFALIQIIEPLGRVILSKKEIVNEGRNYFKITLKDFPRGSYFLLIQDELGNQIHRKFVH